MVTRERVTREIAAQDYDEALALERQRIAADLHDGPLQSIAALQWRLEGLEKLIRRDPAAAAEELAQIRPLAAGQVDVLRGFLASLRQEKRGAKPLGESLAKLRESFEREGGPAVDLQVSSEAWSGNAERNPEIVSLVREALVNVRKHACATCVHVSVGRQGETLGVVVHDNGRGFPMTGTYSLEELEALDAGPKTIRWRVKKNGGALEIESNAGHGAVLRIKMPV
jgi:signal transduction histidine kinase